MKVADLIGRLRERGVVLVPDGCDHVVVRGPEAVLAPSVREAIARNEAAIQAALEFEYRGSAGPCARCGRAAWAWFGAERLPDGGLACGDCVTPEDVAAGSVPIAGEGAAPPVWDLGGDRSRGRVTTAPGFR